MRGGREPSTCPKTGRPLERGAWRSRWSRLLFPVTGLAALIWFCVRVIPKPSRVRYPCQRVAFPIATGFLIWLGGAIASLAAVRKARRCFAEARYVVAGVMLVAAVGALWLAGGIAEDRPALAHVGNPNVPLGTARGLFPGRVAWVRDPGATDWAGVGSGVRPYDATDQAVVDNIFSQALRAYTGESTDAAAWDAVFRHFNQARGKGEVGYVAGEKIALKANFTLTFDNDRDKSALGWFPNRPDCVDNSPQLTIALLEQLVNVVGVAPADITIGDPGRMVPNYWKDAIRARPALADVQLLDRYGTAPDYRTATWSAVPFYWSDPDPTHFDGVTEQDYLPVSFAEAAYLINFPVLTSHDQSGVTLCAKNHYGSLIRNPNASEMPDPTAWYDMHLTRALEVPGMDHYRALVDLMGHEELGGKTLLYVVDGLFGAVGWMHEPVQWQMFPFSGDWTNSVFVSQDPVAVDSVCFDLLYTEYDDGAAFPYDYPRMDGAEDYLHEAAMAASPPCGAYYDPENDGSALGDLGVHEHWSDAAYKQYTRNLGTGDGIELIGVMLDLSGQATAPTPANGATDIDRNGELSWTAAAYADEHDVYLGTDRSAVLNADHSSPEYQGTIAGASLEPGTLQAHTTYYWAVDGVKGAQTWPGQVWSFATSNAVPGTPSGPSPADGASGQSVDVDLAWTACIDPDGDPVTYDVYLGAGALPGAPTATGLSAAAFDPGTLAGHTVYHWQVIAKDDQGGESAGPEWTFRTRPFEQRPHGRRERLRRLRRRGPERRRPRRAGQ